MILALGWFGGMLATLLIFVCILLIGLILLQKNRGAGLSGAFGGAGGYSAFGTKTGDFLTWVTVSFVGVFLLLAIVLNYMFEPSAPAGTPPLPAVSSEQTAPTAAPVSSTPQPPVTITQTPTGSVVPSPAPIKLEPVTPPSGAVPPPATTQPAGN